MTGTICGIKRCAVHDGDGLRTTVFFKGCPLRCLWCHNPEGLSFSPEIGFWAQKCLSCGLCAASCPEKAIRMQDGVPQTDRTRCTGCGACAETCPTRARTLYGERWQASALAEKLMEDRTFFALSGGGVTLSGGECLAQAEFAAEVAKILFSNQISVDVDTCGFVPPEALRRIAPYTDTFLYDLKAMDPAVHRRCTGQDNARILENLKMLFEMGCRVEIRYPFVPGYTDGECAAIGAFLQGFAVKKVKVLGYHKLADGKYAALGRENTLPQAAATAEQIGAAAETLRAFGLPAVNGMLED